MSLARGGRNAPRLHAYMHIWCKRFADIFSRLVGRGVEFSTSVPLSILILFWRQPWITSASRVNETPVPVFTESSVVCVVAVQLSVNNLIKSSSLGVPACTQFINLRILDTIRPWCKILVGEDRWVCKNEICENENVDTWPDKVSQNAPGVLTNPH